MEKLCETCKHFRKGFRFGPPEPDTCRALDKKQHPVYGGKVSGIDPGLVRMTLCGWDDPKFWEKATP